MELTPEIAKIILKPLQESGIPPEFGFEFFSVGFEEIFYHLQKEYLQDVIKKGGSTFKFISASYGGGKTHFTKHFREIAWKNNYVTCHVELKSDSIQFNKILTVYQAICQEIQRPLDEKEIIETFGSYKKPAKGIGKTVRGWYKEKQKEFEMVYEKEWKKYFKKYINTITDLDSIYFGRVIRGMLESLMNEDEEKFEELRLWFENGPTTYHKEFGIKKQLDSDTFRMLSSLTTILTDFMGYAGLVIFFDEGERESLRSKEKDKQVNTLRQVIDKCGDQSIPKMMFFYTVPDETEFLQSKGRTYEAIKQRLQKHFSQDHPLSPNINLENLVPSEEIFKENLMDIGRKVANLYEVCYSVSFTNTLEKSMNNIVQAATSSRFEEIGRRRIFIRSMCEGLDLLKSEAEPEITLEIAKKLVKNTIKKLEDDDKEVDEEVDEAL